MSTSTQTDLTAALTFRREGRPDAAVASALKALAADPSLAEAWECVAFIYMKHRQWKPALSLLEMAVKSVPGHPVLETYYALALAETGSLAKAHARIVEVLRVAPNNPQALFARAEILGAAGYYDLARDAYAAAGKDETTRKAAAFGEASARFMTGDFDRALPGLAAMEDEASDAPDLPLWDGKTVQPVVLYGSQGFGDILMFLRYVKPLLKNEPNNSSPQGEESVLTLQIPYQLAQLVRDSFPDLPLIATKDPDDTNVPQLPAGVGLTLPADAAVRCPLIRLSYIVSGAFDPRVTDVPYLRADAAKVAAWEERLASIPRPRIGIVWSGSPRNAIDHRRSVPFDMLHPLIDIAKPHLVSLQMGPEKERAATAGLFDASSFICDFSDSAALVSALDLIITVDTAAAHLAAALGKPVWNLMPFTPTDWRWMLGREDTIWYPSMRLFRQKTPGDWPGVISNLCADLRRFLTGDKAVLWPESTSGAALTRHPQAIVLPGV